MVKIIASHFILGSKKESLKEICEQNSEWDYDRLLLKTGVFNRHILRANESPEDLSVEAGMKCIEKIGNVKEIDGIIFVTQSPSIPLPTRACILQDKLNINSK